MNVSAPLFVLLLCLFFLAAAAVVISTQRKSYKPEPWTRPGVVEPSGCTNETALTRKRFCEAVDVDIDKPSDQSSEQLHDGYIERGHVVDG